MPVQEEQDMPVQEEQDMPVQEEQDMPVQDGTLNRSAIFNSSVDLRVLVDCIRQLINSASLNSYVNDGFDSFGSSSFDSFGSGSSDMIVSSSSSCSSSWSWSSHASRVTVIVKPPKIF